MHGRASIKILDARSRHTKIAQKIASYVLIKLIVHAKRAAIEFWMHEAASCSSDLVFIYGFDQQD